MLAKMKKKQVCQNAPPLSCKASRCTGSNAGVVIVYFYTYPVWRSFLGSYRRFQRNGDDECHGLLLSVLVLAQLDVDTIKCSCRGGEGKDTCHRGTSRKSSPRVKKTSCELSWKVKRKTMMKAEAKQPLSKDKKEKKQFSFSSQKQFSIIDRKTSAVLRRFCFFQRVWTRRFHEWSRPTRR